MAPAVVPAAPKKADSGISFILYEQEEVHPSHAYNARIGNLIERPNSAPLTKFSVDPSRVGQTTIIPLVSPNLSPSITAIIAANLNASNNGFILTPTPTPRARSNSAPNLYHRGPLNLLPPAPTTDYYGDLKRAQRLYGPSARVLIGNLPYRYDDDELAGAVEDAFEQYGYCVACVFRGQGKGGHFRPYAIVQYTKHQDAMAAYCCGQEMEVMGREVRVEFSRFA